METLPLYLVDAFTARPFGGNPAGVCLLDRPRPDDWMQSLAAELKHSETAFLLPEGDGYRLRWFTPADEVDLCGHATLASAYVLFESGRAAPGQQLRFYTRSGLLTAAQEEGRILLDFPATPAAPAAAPAGLLPALGLSAAAYVGKNAYDYLVELPEGVEIEAVQPDFAALKAVDGRGVMVTSGPRGEYDFVSRFFGPQVGIDEDPVTGSAHCTLAPYWSARSGKRRFLAYQASARGGVLRVSLEGERVVLGGEAVIVFGGQLRVQP
ncbi:MAG: PhzF family phenazine biosynthesis protein [Chloroflexi bacterium]|jgi:PhzF family phenazine biosynthesis protein|nr:PhzF family phenazine biosynthesis protein [Chloroflexota bacterium]